MAAKSATATASKSEAVRDYWKAHKSASAKEVVEGLSADGVKVSLALVNKIKYGGAKPAKKSRKKVAKKRTTRKHAESNGVSKAQAIRDAFKHLGRGSRPRDVIGHLLDKGIKVSAAQVSALRKALRKPGRKAGGATVSVAEMGTGGLSIDHLLAAKKLADQVGIEAAKKALDVLARLS